MQKAHSEKALQLITQQQGYLQLLLYRAACVARYSNIALNAYKLGISLSQLWNRRLLPGGTAVKRRLSERQRVSYLLDSFG